MKTSFKLTGTALAVATAFSVLTSASAAASALDPLPIVAVGSSPLAGGVSASVIANGLTPTTSIGATASSSGEVTTTLPGALGTPTDTLVATVQSVTGNTPASSAVSQVIGTVNSVNPVGTVASTAGAPLGWMP